jgi:SH3-like domain-containing protein
LRGVAAAALLLLALATVGCGRIHPGPPPEYVYVVQKDAVLRDHVAAVSNRTGHVVNGERLTVLERGRRFVRVTDARGETGWIEERYTVSQAVFDNFEKLRKQEANVAPVTTATVRDDVAMHLTPGRETDHLYLLKEGDKLQLLERASTVKPMPAQALPLKNATPAPALTLPPRKGAVVKGKHSGPAAIPGAPVVPMEDWWLARDAQGRVGWVLGRRFDVDVPDGISGYAENQRFVAVYVLTTVTDPQSSLPGNKVPVYLALLAPYKDGLPYDYNQARVFGWSLRNHRYETSFRQHGSWGYLPVVIAEKPFPDGTAATFTLRVSPTEDATIDPATGIAKPVQTNDEEFRMDGPVVKRVLPEGATARSIAPRVAHHEKSAATAPRRKHH